MTKQRFTVYVDADLTGDPALTPWTVEEAKEDLAHRLLHALDAEGGFTLVEVRPTRGFVQDLHIER